jgi:hypothetical protein
MMKRIFTCLACIAALALTACTGESQFPTPSGEGVVRGMNAIPGAPTVTFKIEERVLGVLPYKNSSTPASYDNFSYNFNFDIQVPGEDDPQRIASVATQIENDREYVFVLSGSLANPVVTTWDTALRDWGGTETVFEARFAHLAGSLADVDVYFYNESGPAPVQGEQVATLSYGDVMDIADFEEGSYVVLVTAAGDIGTVYHESSAVLIDARSSQLISIFDGNANDTSPYILQSMSSTGQARRWPDPAYPPTIRFIHGATTLPAVDIYDDEALTSLVATNLSVGETTGDIETEVGEVTWYFTPTGSTATVLLSQTTASPLGTRLDLYIAGTTDDWGVLGLANDRAPADTSAKVSLFHSVFEASAMDLYLVDRGVAIADGALPTVSLVNYGASTNTLELAAGSYDLFVTTAFTKTVLGGPYELDVVLGDVVFLLAYDDELNPGSALFGDVSLP